MAGFPNDMTEIMKICKKYKLKLIEDKAIEDLNESELQWKFMLLVENIARKFSTTQQASGVMSINDLIQEGNFSLTKAIRKIEVQIIPSKDLGVVSASHNPSPNAPKISPIM
jgi:DNA-directed RNA polymerase specialized sigma subunit